MTIVDNGDDGKTDIELITHENKIDNSEVSKSYRLINQ